MHNLNVRQYAAIAHREGFLNDCELRVLKGDYSSLDTKGMSPQEIVAARESSTVIAENKIRDFLTAKSPLDP